MELAQGRLIANRFRLQQELGTGAMGRVWLAEEVGLGYLCAVKFIQAELAELSEVRARFEQEAKVAAQLRSHNIVRMLDYGIWEGVPYMAMEYLEGEDLEMRLRRVGRLEPRATIAIINQVARALGKAHAAGLVHRDLKPENIFITPDEDREIVKVLDFGVAKALGGSGAVRTQKGMLIGTLEYMSPEQLRGLPSIDHRCDLWSLAVVTFLCLTGRLPFDADRLGDLIVRVFGQPLPRAADIAPDLPLAFDTWWARAASRDPDERFQSAREMANALALALDVPDQVLPVESERIPMIAPAPPPYASCRIEGMGAEPPLVAPPPPCPPPSQAQSQPVEALFRVPGSEPGIYAPADDFVEVAPDEEELDCDDPDWELEITAPRHTPCDIVLPSGARPMWRVHAGVALVALVATLAVFFGGSRLLAWAHGRSEAAAAPRVQQH